MTAQDDPHRSPQRDPFDFREPPAPLRETARPTPGPPRSPFDFPDRGPGPGGRGPLSACCASLARALTPRTRYPEPAHPAWLPIGVGLLVVALVIVLVLALG